jgi:predicted metalloprotease
MEQWQMAFNPQARLDPSQVEDRRGRGRLGPIVAGGGGISILALVVSLLLGVNPFDTSAPPAPSTQPEVAGVQSVQDCRTGADANEREDCQVVGFVDSIQQFWAGEFARHGGRYTTARTVLFSGATQAGCGFAEAAMGPFYCPRDQKVYLDLSFFEELRRRFGAQGGAFARGYVIAHEYGHHIQHTLGLLGEEAATTPGAQGGAVRIELQADCLAGVWFHHADATGYLKTPSQADVAAALDAAAAVGDDRIQRQVQGRVTPESWTHGSSAQRQRWLSTGMQTGDLNACDTSRGSL